MQAALSVLAVILLPTGVFFAINAEATIAVLLGPQWDAAVLPFAFLCLAMYPAIGLGVVATYLGSIGTPLKFVPFYMLRFVFFVSGVTRGGGG